MMRVRNYVCAKFSALQDALQERLAGIDSRECEMEKLLVDYEARIHDLQAVTDTLQETVAKLVGTNKAFWQWEGRFTEHLGSIEEVARASAAKVDGQVRTFMDCHEAKSHTLSAKLGELDQVSGCTLAFVAMPSLFVLFATLPMQLVLFKAVSLQF